MRLRLLGKGMLVRGRLGNAGVGKALEEEKQALGKRGVSGWQHKCHSKEGGTHESYQDGALQRGWWRDGARE